ncbi:MAG: carboxypeptidase regulatory-like domain-containing protein [Planctomycetes bacterium]|nr:carboxypeptidase regulatory-like domain-containing protein [Planctomycetota bacterium]
MHHPEASGDGRGQAARSAPLELPRDTGTVPLPEIATSIGSALRGTLRDERGNPVSGVAVQVRGEGLTRVIESGVSGMFRLAGLWPGRYEILPLGHRGSLGRSQQVVVDRPYVDCDVRLQATVERRLQVLDEAGAPVARAHVAATFQGERCAVAQADGDGWAALRVAATDTDFEVHDADELQARPVRRYDGDHGRLVVARP